MIKSKSKKPSKEKDSSKKKLISLKDRVKAKIKKEKISKPKAQKLAISSSKIKKTSPSIQKIKKEIPSPAPLPKIIEKKIEEKPKEKIVTKEIYVAPKVIPQTIKTPSLKPVQQIPVSKPHEIKKSVEVSKPPATTKSVEKVKEKVIEKPPLEKISVKVEVPSEIKPSEEKIIEEKSVELGFPITLKDLAIKIQQKPSDLIKKLMTSGIMATLNQSLDEKIVEKLSIEFGFKFTKAQAKEEKLFTIHTTEDNAKDLEPRAPVVTIMGHVDHGKTSILDAIRKSNVTEKEYGGITQHIGAYRVSLPSGKITFLDTPGHEAFTQMRSRGAKITDIVVLVVAADDGVMPQTVEALDHAKEAGVPIVVAINKIDKPGANLDKVKKQLQNLELVAEDWGGKTVMVGVSAKTGQGINNLLEMILLEAEMLELKSNYKRLARGVVVEAKLSKGRGPVTTLLVQNGTLHLNDSLLAGQYSGKVRAMFDDHGKALKEAVPSVPVEILGLSGVPDAGEQFFVFEDERVTRDLALSRQEQLQEQQLKQTKRVSLEDLHNQIKEGKIKELKLILKADVQGSLEAIDDSLKKLEIQEVQLRVIHKGVGAINTSDVILANASDAIILGFHVEPDVPAKDLAVKESIDIRTYNVIYELINDLKAAVEGLLEPKLKKVFLGRVEVRKVFKVTKAGTIAGCYVQKGKLTRASNISLLRNGEVIFEGKIHSLKHVKDDVREVEEGRECGISLSGFDSFMPGDIIEAYEIEKIIRRL